MFDIPFVKPTELLKARAMEDALLELPDNVVTFAGVVVEPTVDSDPTYYVTVGCIRPIDLSSCSTAVFMHLRKHWKTEQISVHAFWGRVRENRILLTSFP